MIYYHLICFLNLYFVIPLTTLKPFFLVLLPLRKDTRLHGSAYFSSRNIEERLFDNIMCICPASRTFSLNHPPTCSNLRYPSPS
ncbi:hypothetical protein BDZ97DRAFT_1847837 [Flammula alnicola]|nr:hypothetical protein BDZ97DRAFT_1847837 [Flammula alnicola]